MKKVYYVKVLFAAIALCTADSGFAQNAGDIRPALVRQAAKAERLHRQQQASAVVSFEWEKPVYLSDTVRRTRPGFKDVLIKTLRKATACRGVLPEWGNHILTPASCAQAPDGFSLTKVRVQLANGRQGSGSADSVVVSGNLAGVLVSDRLVAGLQGAAVAAVPEGKSLTEAFGNGVQQQLLQFFVHRGVVSPRASRLAGVKNTLKKGEPFFYQGKVVALVNEVPRRLPVSFWGGVSEEPLTVLRAEDYQQVTAAR